MSIEVACLAAGIIPGHFLRHNKKAVRLTGFLTSLSVHILLFFLGASLGADAALFPQLGQLGLQAGLLGLLCSLGGATALALGGRFFYRGAGLSASGAKREGAGHPDTLHPDALHPDTLHPDALHPDALHPDAPHSGAARQAHSAGQKPASPKSPGKSAGEKGGMLRAMAGSARILAFFAAGLALGRLNALPALFTHPEAALWMLRLMMLGVGLGLGFDLKAFGVVRELGFMVLLVPLLVVAGTALGAVATACLLPGLPAEDALCAGAGFGYYSLSSMLLTQLGNAALGSMALLSNITRELFSLVSAPVLARLLGPLAPVGSAGATSMDTCLPVIVRFCGERSGILAVFSGICLTLSPPFVIPLLYNLTH